jgi:hypothetical protein
MPSGRQGHTAHTARGCGDRETASLAGAEFEMDGLSPGGIARARLYYPRISFAEGFVSLALFSEVAWVGCHCLG